VRTGFAGAIHPVNPRYDELLGLTCYPDVGSIPEPPEIAYVLLPAVAAVEAVRASARAGVKVAIVCSSGFSELGEAGLRLQAELGAIVEEHDIRVLGPNCIGIVSPSGNFVGAPTFNITYDQIPGGVSILSHSGGIAVTVFNRAQAAGLGVHSVVSLGNEADLTMTTLLESLLEADEVHTIALVVEQVREPAGFVAAAREAARQGKQLVALKTGRSEVGSAAVRGHTGALAGDGAVFSTVLREAGVLEATSIDQLVDTVHLLATTRGTPIGNRIGVVSPSGGETVYVADQAAGTGIELPPMPEELGREIKEWMPLGTPANPLDLTGQIIGDSELLTKVLSAMGAKGDVDLLMVCLATWGEYDADAILSRVLHSARAVAIPVVFSAWDAGAMTARVVKVLGGSGLPWFPSPDRALAAVRLASLAAAPVPLPDPAALVFAPRPEGFSGSTLGEHDAATVLRSAGVAMAEHEIVDTPERAVEVAAQWGGDVVLKLHAPEVVHKSELGLVEVDLSTNEAIRAAGGRLLERAEQQGLRHHGLLVARKECGVEVIVGGIEDPTFGRFVLVGAGGVLAEHLADTVLVSAPTRPDTVLRALATLTSWPVIQGLRGQSYDVDALVELVVDFSRVFAGSPWMSEVDLNPVLVRLSRIGGAVAVDAVIISEPVSATAVEPAAHLMTRSH
jgi:acetate---CoA ligase (ADP-forming)